MQVVKSQKLNIKLMILVTMVVTLFIFQFGPTVLANESIEQKGTIIAESVYYNTLTQKYEFNSEAALNDGLTENEVKNAAAFFEGLSVSEVANMNKEIGFEASIENLDGEITPFFIPAIPAILIPIGKYLVGTAGAVIIYHVITYGIIKACKNLEGDYWFFTDFCETNGWL